MMEFKDLTSSIDNFVDNLPDFVQENWNLKLSWPFAAAAGVIVFTVNSFFGEGVGEGVSAGLKQSVYTLAAGSFNSRICERVTTAIEGVKTSIVAGAVTSTTSSFLLSYGWHHLWNSEDPLLNAGVFVPLNLALTGILANHYSESDYQVSWMNRGRLEKSAEYSQEE